MKLILLIGAGSFAGGILRYLISVFIQNKTHGSFPYGTLLVNIIGCFLIGIVFSLFESRNIHEPLRLFLAVGILGGFTTFSTFSLDTLTLFRSGDIAPAFGYIALSVLGSLAATFLGIFIGKLF